MLKLIGLITAVAWAIVSIPVARMAYKKNLADPEHGTAVDIAMAVGKGIIWPPYLLWQWLRKYIQANY